MKYWIVRGSFPFGTECEVVESLGIQEYFSERYGDCETEHLLVKVGDKEHHVDDYELVPAGDWHGAAARFKYDQAQELRDFVADALIRAKGITAEELAKTLKFDLDFTKKMLERMREFKWAVFTEGRWHVGNGCLKRRMKLDGPVSQDQFNTYFVASFPADIPYEMAKWAVSEKCWEMGYYGGRIESALPVENGQNRYKIAAYKD